MWAAGSTTVDLRRSTDRMMRVKLASVAMSLWFGSFLNAQDVFECARTGNVARIEQLATLVPDTVNARNQSGFTPLIIAAYRGQPEAVAMLLKKHADIDAGSSEGTALIAATFQGNAGIVRGLLANGAKVDAVNEFGVTALMYAAMAGSA